MQIELTVTMDSDGRLTGHLAEPRNLTTLLFSGTLELVAGIERFCQDDPDPTGETPADAGRYRRATDTEASFEHRETDDDFR